MVDLSIMFGTNIVCRRSWSCAVLFMLNCPKKCAVEHLFRESGVRHRKLVECCQNLNAGVVGVGEDIDIDLHVLSFEDFARSSLMSSSIKHAASEP